MTTSREGLTALRETLVVRKAAGDDIAELVSMMREFYAESCIPLDPE